MIYLDTNILMRYLLDDHPELSKKAQQIIDSEKQLFICESVFTEIVYVLSKVYEIERDLIKQTLLNLLGKENLFVYNLPVFTKSLELYATKKIDFVDCLLCSYNLIENVQVATFDKALAKLLKQ
jgi:predicted nucleic-acid-binding protein